MVGKLINMQRSNIEKNEQNVRAEREAFRFAKLEESATFECRTDGEGPEEADSVLRKRDADERGVAGEEKARVWARANGGALLRRVDRSDIFILGCEMEHRFMLSEAQVESGVWCPACGKLFASLQRFAQDNGGVVRSARLVRRVEFECGAGHVWSAPAKKALARWCKDCAFDQRNILRDLNERENRQFEEQKKILQNQLLEEAKLRMFGRSMRAPGSDSSQPSQSPQGASSLPEKPRVSPASPQDPCIPDSIRSVIAQVESIAARRAATYLQENQSGEEGLAGLKKLNSGVLPQGEQINSEESGSCGKSSGGVRGDQGQQVRKDESNNFTFDFDLGNNKRASARNHHHSETPRREERREEGREEGREEKEEAGKVFKPFGVPSLQFQKLAELFKVLIIPTTTLYLYYCHLSLDQLRNEFRTTAMLIHPDKNTHPSAKVAFQKMLEQFERAQIR